MVEADPEIQPGIGFAGGFGSSAPQAPMEISGPNERVDRYRNVDLERAEGPGGGGGNYQQNWQGVGSDDKYGVSQVSSSSFSCGH